MTTILNRASDKGIFKAWIPLEYEGGTLKIVEKEVTLAKGADPVTRKFLSGVASNTQIDKEDERVSANFIKKMRETAIGLNVFLEHEHTLDKTLGTVSASGGDENNFTAETMLEPEEDNEHVAKVLRKSANGIKLGYSIGGRVTHLTKGVEDGKNFVNLEDGDLFELSITPMPAGNGTWVQTIAKSMKELVKEYEEHENKDKLDEKSESHVTEKGIAELATSLTELLTTPNLDSSDFSKALEEMVQVDEIRDQMFDFWWAFREAIHFITFNEDLTPDQKGDKIQAYAQEFADKIVELTSTLADLVETIDEAITS